MLCLANGEAKYFSLEGWTCGWHEARPDLPLAQNSHRIEWRCVGLADQPWTNPSPVAPWGTDEAGAGSYGPPVLRYVVRIARAVHDGRKRHRFQNCRITLTLGSTGEDFRGDVGFDG